MFYKTIHIAEETGLTPTQVRSIINWYKLKPIRPKAQYYDKSVLLFVKDIAIKRQLKKEGKITNKKVEVIEVPKLITKEITFYIYQSKLNFLTLEQL